MGLPRRDALIDVEWLARTHAAEGYEALLQYVRNGAEMHGEPVTAIAEAVLDLRSGVPRRLADAIDLRHGLAHGLATGSWSRAPVGGRTLYACAQWLWPALPPELQAAAATRYAACEPPLIPDIERLHLINPLDGAWVGHSRGIWSCDVSPDGRWLVSASDDVAVWNMALGTLVARGYPRAGVRDCTVLSDGQRLVSTDATGNVTLWDVGTMTALGEIEAPPAAPFEVHYEQEHKLQGSPRRWRRFAVSPGEDRIAVAGWKVVHVWNLAPLELVAILHVEQDVPPGMLTLFFDSDTTLVTIGRNSPIPVLTWHIPSRRLVNRSTLTMPKVKDIQRALVTPDHRFLVAVGYTDTICWRLDSPEPVGHLSSGASGQAVAVSADSTLAAVSGRSRHVNDGANDSLRLFTLPDLREVGRWSLRELGCRDIACALAFAPDNRHLVVAGWEGVLRRLSLPAVATAN